MVTISIIKCKFCLLTMHISLLAGDEGRIRILAEEEPGRQAPFLPGSCTFLALSGISTLTSTSTGSVTWKCKVKYIMSSPKFSFAHGVCHSIRIKLVKLSYRSPNNLNTEVSRQHGLKTRASGEGVQVE